MDALGPEIFRPNARPSRSQILRRLHQYGRQGQSRLLHRRRSLEFRRPAGRADANDHRAATLRRLCPRRPCLDDQPDVDADLLGMAAEIRLRPGAGRVFRMLRRAIRSGGRDGPCRDLDSGEGVTAALPFSPCNGEKGGAGLERYASVIPAKAGIQRPIAHESQRSLDSRFRGNDTAVPTPRRTPENASTVSAPALDSST